MPNAEYIPVKYARNADETSATGAVAFNDDDRPDLLLGHVGLVTVEERDRLGTLGIIFEDADAEDVPEEVQRAANSSSGAESPEPSAPAPALTGSTPTGPQGSQGSTSSGGPGSGSTGGGA